MMTDKDFGYKVCYKQNGKMRLKVYLVTNCYDSALWHIRWYESHSPPNRKTNKPLHNVTWSIVPIKHFLEYKWLWRGCPF